MEKGEILLLGQRMIMAPAVTFYYLEHALPQNELSNKLIYYACKLANTDGYAKGLFEHYNLKGEKLLQWMANSAQLAGWGEFNVINIDRENKRTVMHVNNSAIAQLFKNSKEPVDHIVRGYSAGVASLVFEDNIDFVETKCAAMGDKYCEFISKPTKDFDFSSELVSNQLDESGEIEKRLRETAWRKKQ